MEMGTMKMTMEESKDKSATKMTMMTLPSKKQDVVEEYHVQVTDQKNHFEEPFESNICDNLLKPERNQSKKKLCRYDQFLHNHHHHHHQQQQQQQLPGHHNRHHHHHLYSGSAGCGETSEVTATDVPIDLSKRSVILSSTPNVDDDDVRTSLQDDQMGDSFDEPLNLSVNSKSSSECRRIWRSCPRLNGSSGGTSGGGGANSELLQKRVRLEEMVSYIRRCSNYVDGKPDDAEEVEDEEDVRRTQVAVKRSFSYSQLETLNGKNAGHHHHYRDYHSHLKAIKGTQQLKKIPKKMHLLRATSESDTSTYPVLRQQLLTVDATGVTEQHSTSFTAGCTKEVIEEDLENDGDDEHEEEEEEEVVDEDEEVEDKTMMDQDDVDGRETRDSGEFLRHQMRLLSSGSPNGQCLPWSAYAYYANLLQELQGSLNSSSNTTTSPLALPISLPLPLSMSSTTRSESPLSDNGSIPVATLADGNGTARKRAPRALTGKHVKHGTGASPATLLTLRQKIEQRNKNHHHNNHNHQPLIKNDRKEQHQQHKSSKMNNVVAKSRKKITS